MKKIIPKYKSENPGHYTPGVISNGILYISGQLAIDPNTRKLVSGGVEEHTKQALKNLNDVLIEAGITKNHVVQCRIYISDISYWDKVNEVYSNFFGSHKPSRVVVPTRDLHYNSLIEIEAIAEMEEL